MSTVATFHFSLLHCLGIVREQKPKGKYGRVFAHEDEFPRAICVVSGDVIEFIVDSPLSCEESGRALIWDFRYETYYYRKKIAIISGDYFSSLEAPE